MKFKKVLFSLVFILSMLIVKTVKADSPQSFTLISNGHVNKNGEILRGYSSDLPSFFAYKYANIGGANYIVLCTGYRRADATSGTTYTKSNNLGEDIRAGMAAIIINGMGVGAKTSSFSSNSSDLYFTQIALWKYIQQEIGTNEELDYTLKSCNSTQLAKVNSLYDAGEAAKTRYNTIKKFAIKLDATKLNFTLNGDYYDSQVIKVSGSEIKTKNPSVSKGTIVEKDGGYVVRIAKNLLSIGKNTITFKVDATSNSIPIASNYSNGRSNEQTATLALFDNFSKSSSISITGDINIETDEVLISKQDATNGKELKGATLKLTYPDGHTYSWQSENTPKKFSNLPAGKYTLTEEVAPEGYIKSSETITFNIDSSGKLVDGPIVMKNAPKGRIYISKQDITNNKELKGAELVLKNSKGEIVDSWTSGTTPHPVKVVLSAGEYSLTETAAPEGYEKSTETITFKVNDKGEVSKPVIMYNKPKEVEKSAPTGIGNTMMFALIVAFISFAISFYYYADYKVKNNM